MHPVKIIIRGPVIRKKNIDEGDSSHFTEEVNINYKTTIENEETLKRVISKSSHSEIAEVILPDEYYIERSLDDVVSVSLSLNASEAKR